MQNRLKEIREKKGLSVLELAHKSKVSRQTIYNIEKNAHASVSVRVMVALCMALNSTLREIFFM